MPAAIELIWERVSAPFALLIGMRFGETSALSSVVYALVGLSGLYQATTWKSIQRRWHDAGAVVRA